MLLKFLDVSKCLRHISVRTLNTSRLLKNEEAFDNDSVKVSESMKTVKYYPFEKFDEHLKNYFADETCRTNFPVKAFSLSHYISDSPALQFLAKMNMNLHQVEKRFDENLNFLVRLRLHEDVGPKLKFLDSIGMAASDMGNALTKNPNILNPEISNSELTESLEYFRTKKFSEDSISLIVQKVPQILTTPVERIDGMLGFYQRLPTKYGDRKKIYLTGDELRTIITRFPTLITADTAEVYDIVRMLEMSCGFEHRQIKKIFIGQPSVLLLKPKKLEDIYKFYTREIGLSNYHLMLYPLMFNSRVTIAQPRHMYLKHLRRDVYRWDQPGYVEITNLVLGDNREFCKNLNLNYDEFTKFLKTI